MSAGGPTHNESSPSGPSPQPVISASEQVSRDKRISAPILALVAIFVGAGVFLAMSSRASGAEALVLVAASVVLAAGAGLVLVWLILLNRTAAEEPPPSTQPPPSPEPTTGNRVLNYHVRTGRAAPGINFGQVIGGVVLGLVGIAIGVSMRGGFLVLAVPIAGFMLFVSPRLRGLGIGVLLSLPLAGLIVIGICGGWFR